jgi:protease-4
MQRRSLYGRLILWTGGLFAILLILVSVSGAEGRGGGISLRLRPGVGVVEVRGTLLGSRALVSRIEEIAAHGDVRALLLHIESPGGGVVASDEIYRAVLRAAEKEQLPVVAYLGSVAASGGYYIACAADSIVAHPASTTGSIGVIVQYAVAEELMDKLGIEWETLTTGPYKSMGTPFEETTERQREWFREVLADDYEQFLEVVRRGRGLDEEVLRTYADGRIFTGRQAVRWGFADMTGDLHDAAALAGRMAGLGEDPYLIHVRPERRVTVWDLLLGRAGLAEIRRELGVGPLDGPRVYYLMRWGG